MLCLTRLDYLKQNYNNNFVVSSISNELLKDILYLIEKWLINNFLEEEIYKELENINTIKNKLDKNFL